MKKEVDIKKIAKTNWWMLFLLSFAGLGGVVTTNNMAIATAELLLVVLGWIKFFQLRVYLRNMS